MIRTLAFVLAGCALVLAGCQPKFLTINNLNGLKKGMTREQVEDVLPKSPDNSRPFTHDGRRYILDEYPLETAESKSEERGRTLGGRATLTKVTTHHTNTLFFLYDGYGLRFWGMRGDFAKSEESIIESLLPFIY